MRRADSLQPATVSAYGANRVATQQDQPADIAAIFRGDHFRVISRRTCQNPRDFSKTLRGKKKIRGSGPFRGEKARQNRGFRRSKAPETGPYVPKAVTMEV
jgi:hypothetical protein